ncbi:MAG TPA: hypothetical protein QGF35_02885, partial [Dehalococcoidia bacterium]|nr:hypothetical protein [Dehalococcoidia bacterium]
MPLALRTEARRATAEDAPDCATILAHRHPSQPASAGDIAGWLQTGTTIFLATRDGTTVGMARHTSTEGIDWFDLLSSVEPGAGAALVRFFVRFAQDRGVRLVRTKAPDDPRFEDYFGFSGFRPVGTETAAAGDEFLILERRVPLLTVREMRRDDAEELAAATGGEPWDFQHSLRPGWFVLSDGDSYAGYVRVRETGRGIGRIAPPDMLPAYRKRGLELWMVERAVYYGETTGFHTLHLEVSEATESLSRELED